MKTTVAPRDPFGVVPGPLMKVGNVSTAVKPGREITSGMVAKFVELMLVYPRPTGGPNASASWIGAPAWMPIRRVAPFVVPGVGAHWQVSPLGPRPPGEAVVVVVVGVVATVNPPLQTTGL